MAAFLSLLPSLIGLGGSIGGALIGKSAAEKAADTQAQSAANALSFQKDVYGTQQKQVAPYLSAGQAGLNELTSAMPELTAGFDPTQYGVPQTFTYGKDQFQADPGYQFALDQANQTIQRSAAAKGGLVSGGTLKDLSAYTTGAASQQYNTVRQRAANEYQQNYANLFNTFKSNQTDKFNRLNSLVGTGLQATGMSGQAGQNYAANAGQYAIQAGNAQAAGTMGAANALASGLGGAGNAVSGGVSAYQNQQYQNDLLNALRMYGSSVSQPAASDLYGAAGPLYP